MITNAKTRLRNLIRASPTLITLAMPVWVYAEDPGRGSESSYSISGSPFYQSAVNIDGGGEFSLASGFLRLQVDRPVNPNTVIGLSIKYDIDDYDFSGVTKLGGLEPWNDIRRFGIGVPIFIRFDNNWSLGISPSVDWLREDGADSGQSVSFGAPIFALKSFARDKSLGLGAGIFRNIEDELEVFPFLAVNWRFNEHWLLSNPFEAEVLGPAGLELSYAFNDRWHLGGGGVYRSFRFRLDKEGAAPNGIGENEGIASFLHLSRVGAKKINMDFYAGAVFGGKLTLLNADGNEINSSDYNTAPFVAFTIGAGF